MRSHDQLTALLDDLEAGLPAMIAAYPDEGDFWSAFAGQADVIEDASGSHCQDVQARLDAMLAQVGYGAN